MAWCHIGISQRSSARRTGNTRRCTRELEPGDCGEPLPHGVAETGLALAIRYEALMEQGAVDDFTEIAEQGGVTRARVTQIMNLRNLAPSIQEQLLILSDEARITERDLRAMANQLSWAKQIRMFSLLAPGMKPKSAIV